MATQSQNPRPSIMLLTFDMAEHYDDLCADFHRQLLTHADVERPPTPAEARACLRRERPPAAVLAADTSLTGRTRVALAEDAATYVFRGGTLVFMGLFADVTPSPDIVELLSRLHLPWRPNDYHRTTFALNPAMTLLDTAGLAARYSQKAVHLARVANHDAVYLPTPASRLEEPGAPAWRVDDLTQAPVAFACVGAGKVGYVGDVNNEPDTTTVVLWMCGLEP